MHALIPLGNHPDDYHDLREFLTRRYGSDCVPELVALTDDGNAVRMDAAESFYREELAQQPEMAGLSIRPWDDLPPADREAFAADLGNHIEWLFPEDPMYYQPAEHVRDIITLP